MRQLIENERKVVREMWRCLSVFTMFILLFTACTSATTKQSSACTPGQIKTDSVTNKSINEVQSDFETEANQPRTNIHKEKSTNNKNTLKHDSFNKRIDKYNPNFPKITKHLPDENSTVRKNEITHIIIHFTSDAGKKPENPYDIDVIYEKFKRYGVSAHYVINRQGDIYEFVPEHRVAYHAGEGSLDKFPQYDNKLSDYSIGIELMGIGTETEMLPMMSRETYSKIAQEHIGFTELQYDALNVIIDDLIKRYPDIKRNRHHIIGHEQYAPNRKTDPGSLFDWSKIGL